MINGTYILVATRTQAIFLIVQDFCNMFEIKYIFQNVENIDWNSGIVMRIFLAFLSQCILAWIRLVYMMFFQAFDYPSSIVC